MNPPAAQRLLDNLCAVSELRPEYWNIYEPINRPFDNISDVVGAMVSRGQSVRTLVFLVRKTRPRNLISVDLCLGPVQWQTPHNKISIRFEHNWPNGEHELPPYLSRSILPCFPDYASVPDGNDDTERYKEFRRSYTSSEIRELFSKKWPIVAPFGPHGCLGDIHWFNYFGAVYVDFIGKARLMAAQWARIDKIGDGLACYATEKIDDPDSRVHRNRIAECLREFVWMPGCKAEDKRIPIFDYSEQLAALPPEARRNVAERLATHGPKVRA